MIKEVNFKSQLEAPQTNKHTSFKAPTSGRGPGYISGPCGETGIMTVLEVQTKGRPASARWMHIPLGLLFGWANYLSALRPQSLRVHVIGKHMVASIKNGCHPLLPILHTWETKGP